MSGELTGVFDVAAKVMDFTTARARALNTNLANAGTAGYRRVDVSFETLAKALREEEAKKRDATLAAAAPRAEVDARAPVSGDGNSVNFEIEQVQGDKNALLHQLAATMVSNALQQMRAAISGRS
ncbi:MAG TPA: flagellar basal body rod protein FlgB [Planctomycetota bacterium]|nr:flagellar basal body rod protein FlgB [Planctomycetota bacterium]